MARYQTTRVPFAHFLCVLPALLARLVLLGLLVLTAACSTPRSADTTRIRVVASVSPITSLVESVGRTRIELVGMVPEGVNSHTFEPAPSDARVLAEADLIFINGLRLEEPIRKLAQANMKDGARLVELGNRAVGRHEWIFDFSFPKQGGDPNPHLWTNPLYAERFARIITEELAEADPANAARYNTNLRAVTESLQELDRVTRAATATIPSDGRKLLTYHDSFPYFAREYGWTVVGAIQPSDFSEPTPREVARLIDQIRNEKVPAIFGSEVFPSPVLEQIAREAGARYVDDLRDDDLPGSNGDPDHTYIGLMKFNLITIVEALDGDASSLRGLNVSFPRGDARYR